MVLPITHSTKNCSNQFGVKLMIPDYIGRVPNKHLWSKFKQLDDRLISLEVFNQKWNVSRGEISRICHCSLDTVNGWYCKTPRYSERKPQIHHLLWLTITDKVWSSEIRSKEMSR